MEIEKRKKVSPGSGGGVVEVEETKKKKKTRETAAVAAEAEVDEPTTEEVEEFYAILRRMNMAMRYLKGAEKRLTGRKAAAAAETAVVRMVDVGKKIELDLNEVPADSAN